jgi:hypothetical protein
MPLASLPYFDRISTFPTSVPTYSSDRQVS